jgi:hypothetical protein
LTPGRSCTAINNSDARERDCVLDVCDAVMIRSGAVPFTTRQRLFVVPDVRADALLLR